MKYNTSTQLLLKDISHGKLSPELLDEIQEYTLIYYEGGIVVSVKFGSESIKIHLKQDFESLQKDLNQFLETEASEISEEDKFSIIQQFLVKNKF